MSEVSSSSYDELPYSSNPFHYTHPNCLATVARLLGLEAPAVDRCRVLELGCGPGGNLVPMALEVPQGQFVGIDLSPRQIDMGRALVQAVGLSNIELHPLSILDVDDRLGVFDYILCHGVYSWVPAEVQDKILEICARRLAPNGLAYVSYNTYPGWHVRGMIREMMGYHVRQFTEPQVRVQQARAFLDFLLRTVNNPNSVYGGLLQIEAELLEHASDTYIYHEHLEEVNAPLYFHQFAERAGARGLQYLGEARPGLLVTNLSPEARQTLEQLSGDIVQGEQYLDFIRNRMFRRSILCHAEVALKRPPAPAALLTLHLTGLAKPVAAEQAAGAEEFVTPDGNKLSTNNPMLKAALHALMEVWPGALSFQSLLAAVQARLPDLGPLDREPLRLAEPLLQCYLSNMIELHVQPFPFVTQLASRPLASPLARLQAATEERLSNLRHHTTELNEFDRLVLRQLDGEHERLAVLEALADLVAAGDFSIEQEGQALQAPEQVRRLLDGALDGSLERIARSALLMH